MSHYTPVPLVGNPSAVAEEAFLLWSLNNGIKTPLITWPTSSRGVGLRGVRAAKSLSPGDELVRVPAALCLTIASAFADPILGPPLRDEPALVTMRGGIDVDAILAIQVLYHKLILGPASPFAPWMNILPDVDTLADWPIEILFELQDNALSETARRQAATDGERCARIVNALTARAPEIFTKEVFTTEWFLWALKIVASRAFGSRVPHTMLVPFADLFDHSVVASFFSLQEGDSNTNTHTSSHHHPHHEACTPPASFAEFDESDDEIYALAEAHARAPPTPATGFFCLSLKAKKLGALTRRIDVSYNIGDEIFISYGRRANEALALDYGFVIVGNEHDQLRIDPLIYTHKSSHAAAIIIAASKTLAAHTPFILHAVASDTKMTSHWVPQVMPFARALACTLFPPLSSSTHHTTTTAIPVATTTTTTTTTTDGGGGGGGGGDVAAAIPSRVLSRPLLTNEAECTALRCALTFYGIILRTSLFGTTTLCADEASLLTVLPSRMYLSIAYRVTKKRLIAQQIRFTAALLKVLLLSNADESLASSSSSFDFLNIFDLSLAPSTEAGIASAAEFISLCNEGISYAKDASLHNALLLSEEIDAYRKGKGYPHLLEMAVCS